MKKKELKALIQVLLFIMLVLVLFMAQVVAGKCGDVNSSGAVDIVDALMIARSVAGLNPGSYNSSVADVNGDNTVSILDALFVARFSAGLISSFPGCNITTPTPTPTPTNSSGGVDCSSASYWSATTHYETAGTKVYYNCKLYQNNWYSENENPEQNSGANKVWTLVGTCDPNRTPSPTPTPLPTVSWQGTSGYATRFWDCCKPHCAWTANVPSGMAPLKVCTQDGTTTNSDAGAKSSCDGGSAFVCYKFIPFAVDNALSYGFAATSSGDICGKCFELAFTGHGKYSDTPGAVALKGKRMIVMAINIGYDVSGGQFDLLIPGGGVGAFNGCSTQWGIPNDQLGAQYGGLLSACNQQYGYYDHTAIKNCLRSKNDALFRSRGLTQLAAGLDWFIDWFEAADNPLLIYREVPCPQELIDISGLRRP
jgi:hypothetical protein